MPLDAKSRAVIIGTGVAGVNAAAGMRTAGFDGEILLVGDEPELPYRRPAVSKDIVRGEKTADEIRIKPPAWYTDHNVELLAGVRVTSIDPASRVVSLDHGSSVAFDRLLIATGGVARSLGDRNLACASGVQTVRSLGDAAWLHGQFRPGGRVIVIGAGLVGSEIAASARLLGCDVTILETATRPLPRLLPPVLAEMYVALHKAHGTDLHTDVHVAAIAQSGSETVVRATDGRAWSAPIVVLAIGMVPSTDLAQSAGITVTDGIVVDARGQTSVPGIYAAGDVANMPNSTLGARHRVEHWQNAQNHGAAVGASMAGAGAAFDEVPWCWSDQYGVSLQVTGWPGRGSSMYVRGSVEHRDFIAFFLADATVVGAIAIGRPFDVRTARTWIAARGRLRPDVLVDESRELAESVLP